MITAWCIADGLLRTHRTLFSRSQSRRKNTFSTTASWKWPVDVKSLTSSERERLRLYSKSIPLVVDKEPLDVIYEDEYYLCVNKPDFVKMHPAHRFQGGSLLNRAIGHCGFVPHLLHRLDMVLFAKKKEVCHAISKQFQDGTVHKEYILIADGIPCDSQFEVNAPIQRTNWLKFAREIGSNRPESKHASTRYDVLDTSDENHMTLMRAQPKTGRTHQIRLHLNHIGFPIVGDSLYNPRESSLYDSVDALNEAAHDISKVRFADANPLRAGLKLHAWRITMTNPVDSSLMTFCAPPSNHFAHLMTWADLKQPRDTAISQ